MGTRLHAIKMCEMRPDDAVHEDLDETQFGAVAILNEGSDPSQPSVNAPHRLPSTFRATGHEPAHFGLSPTKNDPDPSEQPL